MNNSLIWLVWFFLFTIIAIVLIPRRQLFALLPFGIIAGFVLTLALLLLLVPILNLWAFDTVPANSLIGVPLTLPVASIPVMMLFAHYLPKMQAQQRTIIWITGFAVFTTLVQGLSVSSGIMRLVQWDLLATLLLTFSGYFILAVFVLKYGAVPDEIQDEQG